VEISDEEFQRIRRTSAYQAALWLARAAAVPVIAFVVIGLLVIAGVPLGLPGQTLVALWLCGGVLTVARVVLLRRVGIRLVRTGLNWQFDDSVRHRMFREALWLPAD
jgi:hypothetical protein